MYYVDASGVFGYSEWGSSPGGMAMFLSGVIWGVHFLGVYQWRHVLPWFSTLFDYPGVLIIFQGSSGLVFFVPLLAFICLGGPVVSVKV